jgi:hypothetical protein
MGEGGGSISDHALACVAISCYFLCRGSSSNGIDPNNGGRNKSASTTKGSRPHQRTATAEPGEGKTSRRCDVLLLLLSCCCSGYLERSFMSSLISLSCSAEPYVVCWCYLCAEDDDQECDGKCPEATRLEDTLRSSQKKVVQLSRDLASSKQKKLPGLSPSHQRGLTTKATNRAVKAEGIARALEDKLADKVTCNERSHQHRCCVVGNHTAFHPTQSSHC